MGERTKITTVLSAASSYDLTTLAIVKEELSITSGGNDAQLQRYITSASIAAASYCNRVFPVETIKDEFWAKRDAFPALITGGFAPLQLSRFPVTTLTSIAEDGVALVEDTDFKVDYAAGQVTRLNGIGNPRTWANAAIAIEYDTGFAPIPSDLADAIVRMVRARWDSKGRDPFLRAENIPGVRDVQYWVPNPGEVGSFSPDVKDLLDGYRVLPIA